MNIPKDQIIAIASLIGIAIYSIVIRINFLELPLERDEGLYIHFAQLILNGKIPYEAFYDPKPAGLFYIYAAILGLFGSSLSQLHGFFIFINIVTAFFVFVLAKKLVGQFGGIGAFLGFIILSMNIHIGGLSVLSEHLVILFTVPGILALLYATNSGRIWFYLLSGFFFGMATVAKQNGVFFIAAGLLYIILNHWMDGKFQIKEIFGIVSTYLITAALPTIIIFIYISTLGQATQYVYWNLTYPIKYLQSVPFAEGLEFLKLTMSKILEGYHLWYVLIALGTVLLILIKRPGKTKWFILIFTVFSILSVTPRWTFHGHYFLLIVPCAAVLIGLVAEYCIVELIDFKSKVSQSVVLFILAGTGILIHYNSNSLITKDPNPNEVIRSIYGSNPFVETYEISSKIKERSQTHDQLVVFGGEMQVYYYTGLTAPTKHLFGPYLVDASLEHRTRQREYIHDIESSMPRFFVAIRHPLSWSVKKGYDQSIMRWYNTFTSQNYDLIGLAEIYYDQPTKYLWDEQLDGHNPSGQHQIYIWEIKPNHKRNLSYVF